MTDRLSDRYARLLRDLRQSDEPAPCMGCNEPTNKCQCCDIAAHYEPTEGDA